MDRFTNELRSAFLALGRSFTIAEGKVKEEGVCVCVCGGPPPPSKAEWCAPDFC